MVPRFTYRGLNFLLEGEIDQRQQNHQTNDYDGGGQQDKERGDGQVTKHFRQVDVPEKVHWGRKTAAPSSSSIIACSSKADYRSPIHLELDGGHAGGIHIGDLRRTTTGRHTHGTLAPIPPAGPIVWGKYNASRTQGLCPLWVSR
jgi:hypothetical protein